MAESNQDNRFWNGQNIFVALLGGGVVVIPEHHAWGAVLICAGAVGFIHSNWRKPMMARPFLWFGAVLLTWIGIGYDYYDRHRISSPTFIADKMEQVVGQRFHNQEVIVDNKDFVDCTFENVSFVYKGTGYWKFNGSISGTNTARTTDPAADTFLQLVTFMQSSAESTGSTDVHVDLLDKNANFIKHLGTNMGRTLLPSTAQVFESHQQENVPSRLFRQEAVVLDGKNFMQCKFDNVTLVYNGTAPAALVGANFANNIVLRSEIPGVVVMAGLAESTITCRKVQWRSEIACRSSALYDR
jgi:hypothetical protein